MKPFELAKRLQVFPPYLFAEIDKEKQALRAQGISFVDLGIGDPDVLAPNSVVEALYASAKIKANQKYALDQGKKSFKEAINSYSQQRFGVTFNADTEILPLIGSKEGLVHFPLAFVNPSDYVIIPSPGYPGYRSAALFCQAKIYEMPLKEKNRFLPELQKIPLSVRNKAKVMYLNYPNNPTSALAPESFLKEAVAFAAQYGIILAYDNAYAEVYFDQKPMSIFNIEGAKEVAIEFHSLSKTFCMTGFRVGWACGNPALVSALLKVKSNVDSGIFPAVQDAAEKALRDEQKFIEQLRSIIKERRDVFLKTLKKSVFSKIYADSTFYVWAKIPRGVSSIEYCKSLMKEKNLVATPGVGFGKYGEGFIRFSLTLEQSQIKKAAEILNTVR